MKIGYRTSGLRWSFAEKLQLAKDLGLETVEVSGGEFKEMDEAAKAKEMAQEMGITISALGDDVNLCVPSLLDETYAKCKALLPICKALGTDIYFSRTLSPAAGAPQKETWETCIEATRKVASMCALEGVRFAIEADPFPGFVNNLERMERLLENVNHPNLYVNFDPTNYYIEGSDPLKVIERLGHLIVNGHIKDGVFRSERREETAIGEGEIEYLDIFRKILERGIDIAMNIEHCSTPEQVTKAASYIKGVLAQK